MDEIDRRRRCFELADPRPRHAHRHLILLVINSLSNPSHSEPHFRLPWYVHAPRFTEELEFVLKVACRGKCVCLNHGKHRPVDVDTHSSRTSEHLPVPLAGDNISDPTKPTCTTASCITNLLTPMPGINDQSTAAEALATTSENRISKTHQHRSADILRPTAWRQILLDVDTSARSKRP